MKLQKQISISKLRRIERENSNKNAAKLYKKHRSLRKVAEITGMSHEWVRRAVYTYPQLSFDTIDKAI